MPKRSKEDIDNVLAECFEEGELEQMLVEAIEKALIEHEARMPKADTDKELAKYFKKGELEQMLGEAVGEALSGREAGKTGRKKTRRKTA